MNNPGTYLEPGHKSLSVTDSCSVREIEKL